MNQQHPNHQIDRFAWGGVLIAVGIVFGDLGTSPLYTFKAIIGDRAIDETIVLGGVSAIFWTLFLQTTLKYVLLTMQADNKGEGGIFSLYALIRRYSPWAVWPAIVGGCFMIADSLITPPISVTSAVEGLLVLQPELPVVGITIGIITGLFLFQQTGTQLIGRFFGPAMVLWFGMIAVLGFINLADNPSVLRAANPWYAWNLLANYPQGFWVLGGVFLCTTGAEALYADMGHVGRHNIRVAWIFIKISLLLCYFGEAAMLLQHQGETLTGSLNAFFGMVPRWFLIPAVAVSTAATVIASQALISGTYTLFNEAIRLNMWPKLRIEFPTELRGQIYIPAINWLMMFGCIGMVLHFRESANMEAAFGLSVTLTMLMTTILLGCYLYSRKAGLGVVIAVVAFYLVVEGTFLLANLKKLAHGGWITLLIAAILFAIIFVWHEGKKLRNRYKKFTGIRPFVPLLKSLSEDQTVPKYATHVVYLTQSAKYDNIEERILDSILCQQPKRADTYWFVHVDVDDEPYTMGYHAEIIAPNDLICIRFRLGFRVVPRISLLLRKVVEKLVMEGKVIVENPYCALGKQRLTGDFRFVIMKSSLSVENSLSFRANLIMRGYFMLDYFSQPDPSAFGLEDNHVVSETYPLLLGEPPEYDLKEEP